MCYSRLQEGEKPACAQACPTGALRFGRREDLLAEAHARIDCNCERYVNHIFGEHEVGGTSMLYLSDIPFEELGFPVGLPQSAPPAETAKIMDTLPYVITGVTALMAGTAAYTHRHSAHSVELPTSSEEQET
jgi:formate dehydrogenase iron-sulfur subunit